MRSRSLVMMLFALLLVVVLAGGTSASAGNMWPAPLDSPDPSLPVVEKRCLREQHIAEAGLVRMDSILNESSLHTLEPYYSDLNTQYQEEAAATEDILRRMDAMVGDITTKIQEADVSSGGMALS